MNDYFIQKLVEPTAVIREKARYFNQVTMDDFVGVSSVGSVWLSNVENQFGRETLVLVRDDQGRVEPSKTAKLVDEQGRTRKHVQVPRNQPSFKWKGRWQVLIWVKPYQQNSKDRILAAFDLENFNLRIGPYTLGKLLNCEWSPSADKCVLINFSGIEGVSLFRSNFDLDRLCPTGPHEEVRLAPMTLPYFTSFFVTDSGDCLLRLGSNVFLCWQTNGTLQAIQENLDKLWDLGRYSWVPLEGNTREECRYVHHRFGLGYQELVVTCESHTLRNRCIGRIIRTCFHPGCNETNLPKNEIDRFPDDDSKFVAKSFWLSLRENVVYNTHLVCRLDPE